MAGRKNGSLKGKIAPAVLLSTAAVLVLCSPGCGKRARESLVLAATRDLEGSGVLQAWVDGYRRRHGREVELVVAPDDDLLDMARHGECDLLVLHSPEDEQTLESEGYVEGRQEVMRDRFILVGPSGDPAKVREAEGLVEAFKRIAESKSAFIMRTDGSGTASQAEKIWGMAGVRDFGSWFRVMDRDMEAVLQEASLRGAYTLCDSSTYRRLSAELALEELLSGGDAFVDPYHVMTVSGLVFPDTDGAGAAEFVEYLLSEEGRRELGRGEWSVP